MEVRSDGLNHEPPELLGLDAGDWVASSSLGDEGEGVSVDRPGLLEERRLAPHRYKTRPTVITSKLVKSPALGCTASAPMMSVELNAIEEVAFSMLPQGSIRQQIHA